VPPSYDGTKQTPVVVNLHGAGSSAAAQAAYSRFPQKGDVEGFIVVTPDAMGTPRAWNFIPSPSQADDIGFIRDILDRMDSQFCVDDTRVYATGISSGAAMSERLACALQDRVAAIGPVSALFYPPNCPTGRAVPVIEFHGTEDRVVRFTGGPTVGGLSSPDIQFAASQWAQADGCNVEPERAQLSEHVRSVTYTACKDGASVVLDAIDGGGHTWPGAPVNVSGLGETTHEISATDEIWKFFGAHPRVVPSP
jgi:polyhydroxybutyrate depolymerase